MPSARANDREEVEEKCIPQVSFTASISDAVRVMQQAGTNYVLAVCSDDGLALAESNSLIGKVGNAAENSLLKPGCLALLTQEAILQAIATEPDLSACDLTTLPVRSILQPVITLSEAEADEPAQILLMFQKYQISHLPILDSAGQVRRVLTLNDLRDVCLRLNARQEEQLQQQTGRLRLVIEFEAILRRIVDRVRSSLDEAQILQMVVEELGEGLGVNSCNVALYDLEQGISTIVYEYNPPLIPFEGRKSYLADYPELYDLLLQGESVQFCNLRPNPIRGRRAILVCPIVDDRQVLGDIWLINDRDYGYHPYEVRLAQQVASHCAIGLRQSRLYQAVQDQVEELTCLNQLKDDFLSTVSHEMRSPIANAKMAAQMLEIVLRRENLLNPEQPAPLDRYLQILKDECQREINLVNDLLDLARLNDDSEPMRLAEVNLLMLIPQVTQGFLERIGSQSQELIFDLPPEMPPLQTEVASLERILIELINNACKYTPPQEKIMIRVAGTPETVQIRTTNTGVEIPETERDRIFERFYRIPNSDPWKHGGTGLGLALVRKLAERLQGEVRLECASNQTTFAIEFPWAIEQ